MATILVVDDRPINRQFLVTLLGYAGHRLLEAADGVEALQRMRTGRPDLVITDILMPNMDGVEFVRQMHADSALAQTPVIFYTATYRMREARSLAESCGVALLLPKPSEPEVILRTVHTALGGDAPPMPVPVSELPAQAGGGRGDVLVERMAQGLADLEAVRTSMQSLIEVGTEAATARDQLRQQLGTLSHSLPSLERMSLRLAALIEAGLDVAAERDPHRLLTMFCRAARDVIGAKYAGLGVLDADGHSLRHFLTEGLGAETHARLEDIPARMGVLEILLQDRQPRRLRDLPGDPQAVGFPAQHPPLHTLLAVPFASRSEVYGWLYLVDKLGADEFSADDEQIAMTLATQVALAYENARLYDEISRRAAALEQEVVERQRVERELQARHEDVKEMSAQLWQAAKLATMGELAASIAHELNNPMTTVSLRVELLLEQVPEDDPRRRSLEVIAQEVDRTASLVANLLQFSRRNQQQISTVALEEEIAGTLELIQYHLRTHRVSVVHDVAPGLPRVQADRQQLRQVFLNLFTNAGDAMPEGGTLTIRLRSSGSEIPGRVIIEIADTGVGIAPEDLPKVTEPFFTTKPEGKGTGLGLPICRRVVEEHHGTLEISSTIGRGTTIRIALPVGNASSVPFL